MSAHEGHEPSENELALAHEAFDVALVSFRPELEKLDASDILPRYHRVKFKIRCRASFNRRPIFLTVRRGGSKIGAENFYTVPFFAEDLPVGAEATYDLLSFDSFNLPFESMAVEMCGPDDYPKRRVSPAHIERARKFATRKNG